MDHAVRCREAAEARTSPKEPCRAIPAGMGCCALCVCRSNLGSGRWNTCRSSGWEISVVASSEKEGGTRDPSDPMAD